MMKHIAILGSTGSIGVNTLNVVRHLGVERFQVKALASHSNIDLLEIQAKEFNPELIAVYNIDKAKELQKRLPSIKIIPGLEGLNAAASYNEVDLVVSAMSGTIGLIPTITAITAGKDIALANKEALVSGGSIVISNVKNYGVRLIPIDSEHSAIFQCLNGENKAAVHRIILTASGGAFRDFSADQLKSVTVDQALKHPTWNMGTKVTIDCSTLMNKGLEVIEAHWLFDIPVEQIQVVIHPQSIIHSMVEFVDNSILAQMGDHSMLTPIQYALTYPERLPGLLKPFDFFKYPTLQFSLPDKNKFRCLQLAFDAIKEGESFPCYMNAANEVLVTRFVKKQIEWNEIASKLENLMQRHKIVKINSLDDVLSVDELARREAAIN